MAQHVRRHALSCKRGTCALSYGDMFGKRVLHRVSTEPFTSATREEKARFVTGLFFEPRFQHGYRWFGQRGAAFSSSFAFTPNVSTSTDHCVSLPQPRKLGETQSCLRSHQQHGVVASSDP